MNHGSLFSGIGGFDLAAEWSGFTNLFNCEWEEFPRKVLKHHFPNAEQFGDIKEFNATTYSGRIDILSGGFPCQPFSVAGKRKGTEDERYLWKEMLRVIRECKPRWVVGENVRGICSWSNGLVFETCCSDLEALGYSVQSFIIPACATNAPHRRDRVWIVAYNHNGNGQKERLQAGRKIDVHGSERNRNAPDTERIRLEHSKNQREMGRRQKKAQGERREFTHEPKTGREIDEWKSFPTIPPIRGGNDGLPKELDGITFSKWRRESIKGYGNAIVPQVAHRIFESIKDYEKRKKSPPPCEELSSHHGER